VPVLLLDVPAAEDDVTTTPEDASDVPVLLPEPAAEEGPALVPASDVAPLVARDVPADVPLDAMADDDAATWELDIPAADEAPPMDVCPPPDEPDLPLDTWAALEEPWAWPLLEDDDEDPPSPVVVQPRERPRRPQARDVETRKDVMGAAIDRLTTRLSTQAWA
jgi:hypothetical protein